MRKRGEKVERQTVASVAVEETLCCFSRGLQARAQRSQVAFSTYSITEMEIKELLSHSNSQGCPL